MLKKIKLLLLIIILSLVPTFLVWTPFFLRLKSFWTIPLPQDGMATIVANYDGPLFLVAAKTFYNLDLIQKFPFTLPSVYYAAHFPLFPLLIKPFAGILGFPYSMLFVTTLSSIFALYYFNKLMGEFVSKKDALWLTFVFSIFPARWLIVRSVGSAEPLFVAATIASLYYFRRQNYWATGIWGVIAQLTKSVGILLFFAYAASFFWPRLKKAAATERGSWLSSLQLSTCLPIFLIPLALLGVFLLYKIKFNDFFAYFHSGDNIHLFFPPFQIFNFRQPWVGTSWLEEIIFVYLFGILGIIKLIQKKETVLAWFVGIFFVSTLFISHRDLLRYSLPLVPFLLVAFSEFLVKKEFKIAIAFLVIPIYLFALSFISQNAMPISDWAPFL